MIGTIAPSCNLNCSTELPPTLTLNSKCLLVVSILILFKGVAKPASPINPITGPLAAVPSCLCPVVFTNAAKSASNSLLNNDASIVLPSAIVLCLT